MEGRKGRGEGRSRGGGGVGCWLWTANLEASPFSICLWMMEFKRK